MDRKTFDELVAKTVKETADLLITKGAEYTDGKDRLSNFKKEATDLALTPLQLCMVYMNKHYTSVKTYVRKNANGEEQILSEPIAGRFNDLINYCFLMKALVEEGREDLIFDDVILDLNVIEEPLPVIEKAETGLSAFLLNPGYDPLSSNLTKTFTLVDVKFADGTIRFCESPRSLNWSKYKEFNPGEIVGYRVSKGTENEAVVYHY